MNKDNTGLSEYERFNLFLSAPAVDRELQKIKKPIINQEPLPEGWTMAAKPSKSPKAPSLSHRRSEKSSINIKSTNTLPKTDD